MKKVTFKNDFHNTEYTASVKNDKLTKSQTRRIRKRLCGVKGCQCGDIRGSSEDSTELYYDAAAMVWGV